jgi:hypothetical protein
LRGTIRKLAALVAGAALVTGLTANAASADTGTTNSGGEVRDALQKATQRGRVLPWFPGREGPTVLTSGLNNPRQLQLAVGDGVLLIAEAGKGGPTCEGEGEDAFCVGDTGEISTVLVPMFGSNKRAHTLVRGLFSGAGPDGSFAVGSNGVSARSLLDLKIVADMDGNLLEARPFGDAEVQASIAGFEAANDPDGQGVESNPYSVLALRDRTLVADAAGNSIVSVDKWGVVSLFAVLPNVTDGLCAGLPNEGGTTGCDFVPTSLTLGPDGAVYVGGLGAETPGAGRVLKLDPNTGAVLQEWGDLFTVTGVGVGRDGSIYASELFGGDPDAAVPGQLTRIAPDGSRSSKVVPFPAGVQVDKYNNVYVAAFSTAPDTGLGIPDQDTSGQIWRLRF